MLYELEYKVNEMRHNVISQIKNEEMTVKEVLDLGADLTYIMIGYDCYSLGNKWKYKNLKTNKYVYGYETYDFKDLTRKMKKVKVRYVDHCITDENYLQLTVRPVNKEDEKYFIEEVR